MSIIVFANLGNRDVVIRGQENDRPPPARQQGKLIIEQLETGERTADQLSFPILQPTLDYILRETDNQIDQLILIATNQIKNEAEPWHWNSDTLYYAQIAKAHLTPQYNLQNKSDIKLIGQKPEVNPSLYDEAFRVYEQLLQHYANDDVTACYLIISGGIPASNTALLLQGVRYFGSRARLIYLAKDNKNPWESPIGRQITDIMRENSARQFLERFDFTAAARLLAQQRPLKAIALALCHYASARLWFDFASARSYLGQAVDDSQGSLRQRLQSIHHSLQTQLDDSQPQREKALLAEIYYNALVAWENERFVDFLGRVVRFQEALIEYLLPIWQEEEYLSRLYTAQNIYEEQGTRAHFFDDLQEAAQSQLPDDAGDVSYPPLIALSNYLEAHFSLGEIAQLCFYLQINSENIPGPTLATKVRELLGYSIRHGRLAELRAVIQEIRPHQPAPPLPDSGRLATLAVILQRLEHLRPLHQQSLIAHGYGGASRDSLLAAYNGQLQPASHSPILDMAEVASLLGLSAVHPFVEIRTLIQQQLR